MIIAIVFFVGGMLVQGFLRLNIVIDKTGCRVYHGEARDVWKIW